jgi:hypothetical protein
MFDPQQNQHSAPSAPASPVDSPNAAPQATTAPAPTYPFRLLADEKVLAMYPVSRMRRPLGKLVSYLFVTDSRVVFSAEAKSITSSSTYSREYKVDKIDGLEVGRDTGVNALALAALVGTGLNVILSLVLWIVFAAAANQSSGYGSFVSDSSSGAATLFAWLFGIGTFLSVILGVIAFVILRSRSASLSIIVGSTPNALTARQDIAKTLFLIALFLIFGPFALLGVGLWLIFREAGIVRAEDAGWFVNTDNLDRISYEAGALILDVQARGKLAGQK